MNYYIEEITRYIKSEYTLGALLINGEWGCGKTYFIENSIMSKTELTNNYIFLKISLFGLCNIQDLDNKIKLSYLTAKSKYENINSSLTKVANLIRSAAKFHPAADTLAGINPLAFIEISNTCKIKKEVFKNVVIILDDLERCRIDSSVLLGLINSLIEDKKIKVVILANEKYINTTDTNNTEISSNFATYNDMKEKVVLRTLNYSIPTTDIVKMIIEEHSNADYVSFLKRNDSSIEYIYNKCKFNNIRSLKCVLYDFERIYEFIHIQNLTSYENIFSSLLVNFLAISLVHKQTPTLLKDDFHKHTSIFDKLSDYNMILYPFYDSYAITMWIIEGTWKERLFSMELKHFHFRLLQSKQYADLAHNNNILHVDDISLKNCFSIYLQDAYNSALSIKGYLSFLSLIDTSILFNVELPEKIDFDKLKKAINDKIKEIIDNAEDEFIDTSTKWIYNNEKVNELNAIISNFLDDFNKIKRKRNMVLLLNSFSYSHEKISTIFHNIDIIDDNEYRESIIKYYKKGRNRNRKNIIKYCKKQYEYISSNSNAHKIHNFLEYIKSEIELIKDDEPIQNALNQLFISTINDLLKNSSITVLKY